MQRKIMNFLYKGAAAARNNDTEEVIVPPTPTVEQIEAMHDLYSTYANPTKCSYRNNSKMYHEKKNLISVLKQREYGIVNFRRQPSARFKLMDTLLPNKGEVLASLSRPVFCGQFSEDGQYFFSACQDNCIRLFDTKAQTFDLQRTFQVEDVGWSILDTALSPDRTTVAYSTWSDCLYLIKWNENENESNIVSLNLRPQSHSFSIFSLQYSADGTEIIGGSNDTCVYVYDLNKHRRTLRVQAHEDDINAVRFIDNSNSLIVSGSDDNFVSVWDRRSLNESNPKPVGIFAGHTSGITFVHSRMDTRYLISNSKDQSIKLWDLRHFSKDSTIDTVRTRSTNNIYQWDYRYDYYGSQRKAEAYDIPGDTSIRTYRGHSVRYTLIRCYFSPSFTTGQKYIITGSSDGCIRIYDVLTGATQLCLRIGVHVNDSREKCVRDVSWHPFEPYMISSSWDVRRSHVRWSYSSDATLDSQSTCSSEPRVVAIQSGSSPTHRRQDSFLRVLLNQQLLDFNSDPSTDEEVLP